jgi:hypothetical protein
MVCDDGVHWKKTENELMIIYAADIEMKMKSLFESLSEKDRRRYAAIEVAKLGHGGTEYIDARIDKAT